MTFTLHWLVKTSFNHCSKYSCSWRQFGRMSTTLYLMQCCEQHQRSFVCLINMVRIGHDGTSIHQWEMLEDEIAHQPVCLPGDEMGMHSKWQTQIKGMETGLHWMFDGKLLSQEVRDMQGSHCKCSGNLACHGFQERVGLEETQAHNGTVTSSVHGNSILLYNAWCTGHGCPATYRDTNCPLMLHRYFTIVNSNHFTFAPSRKVSQLNWQ